MCRPTLLSGYPHKNYLEGHSDDSIVAEHEVQVILLFLVLLHTMHDLAIFRIKPTQWPSTIVSFSSSGSRFVSLNCLHNSCGGICIEKFDIVENPHFEISEDVGFSTADGIYCSSNSVTLIDAWEWLPLVCFIQDDQRRWANAKCEHMERS